MISAHGISVDAPQGWDTEIYVRAAAPPAGGIAPLAKASEVALPVLHLASFGLAPDRGDYGSGALGAMGPEDVFVSLLEHSAEEARTALFAGSSAPWPLTVKSFRSETMQRRVAGFAGHQSFFSHSGRGFCLYVVIGSSADRGSVVMRANQALGGVSLI